MAAAALALEAALRDALAGLAGREDHTSLSQHSAPVVAALQQFEVHQRFNRPMLIAAGGAVPLGTVSFAHQILRSAAHLGAESVAHDVAEILGRNEVPLVTVRLVSGLSIAEPLSVGQGISITPVTALPMSKSQQSLLGSKEPMLLASSVLVVARSRCPSVIENDNAPVWFGLDEAGYAKLTNVIKLLTLIGPSGATDEGGWTQVDDPILLRLIPGGGFGGAVSQVRNMSRPVPVTGEIVELIGRYERLAPAAQSHLDIALARLNLACRRIDSGDASLDAAIALESALSGAERTELTYRLRIRSALLLTEDVDERIAISEAVKRLYEMRSSLVHTGTVKFKGPQDRRTREGAAIVSKVLKRILALGGFPDWGRLELSGGSQIVLEK